MSERPTPSAEPLLLDGVAIGIGALARATGIPVETLRTWERRYGFPAPERDEGGQRLYPAHLVPRLLQVREALERGHRAARVLPLSEAELQRLLEPATPEPVEPPPAGLPAADLPRREDVDPQIDQWMQAVVALDAAGLDVYLRRAWNTMGPLMFLQERAGPLLVEVGERWARGELSVAHEHFASERLHLFLSSIWTQVATQDQGPTVLCATLSGETHVIGLHMAACVLALVGVPFVFLGADLPANDLVRLVSSHGERREVSAVLVSISAAVEEVHIRNQLAQLRRSLPKRVTLLAGGAGAPTDVRGVIVPAGLPGLWSWAEQQRDAGRTSAHN